MRKVAVLMFLLCSVGVFAQREQDLRGLFESIRPQMTVVIKEHPTSAEDVEITMLDPKYPRELLGQQVARLGDLLGVEPRGLLLGPVALQGKDPKFIFMKARFAINGLIGRDDHTLRIAPILKAFAGAPEPYTMTGFNILFDNEIPDNKTVRTFVQKGSVSGVARFIDYPRSIEYKILLETQDPDKITWPDVYEPKPPLPPEKPVPRGQPMLFWILFAVAGLALILLVYFALLRIGRTARK